jgi:hypothetical protein
MIKIFTSLSDGDRTGRGQAGAGGCGAQIDSHREQEKYRQFEDPYSSGD